MKLCIQITLKLVETERSFRLSVAGTAAALCIVVCVATVFAAFFSYCVVNMEGWSGGAQLI